MGARTGQAGLVSLSFMTHSFETLAIHAGQEPEPVTGAVVPPIFATTTYQQVAVGSPRQGYEYSRSGNPTRKALEQCLAALEAGERGFAFASGLAAEDTLLRTICGPGDHVVIPNDAYGGTYRLFAKVGERWGLRWTAAAIHDLDAAAAAITPATRVAPRGRQHLRLALPAAAARARRRCRHAFDHQVLRRAL